MNKIIRFFAAILILAIGAGPLRAQNGMSTNGNDSNSLMASSSPTNAAAASNSVAVAKAKHRKSNESPPVRVDTTGIHVGGDQPVDINFGNPNFLGAPLGFGKTLVALTGILIPIVAIIAVFGLPAAILAIFFTFQHRRNKMVHETLRAMIEKGMPINSELVAQLGASISKKSSRSQVGLLLPGLVLIGLGLASLISDWFSAGRTPILPASIGLIVLFIGIAFLIVWLVERKQNDNQQPPKQ